MDVKTTDFAGSGIDVRLLPVPAGGISEYRLPFRTIRQWWA
jgi:hypothetical protein